MFLKLSEVFKYLHATPDSRCFVEGEQVLHANHLILCGKKGVTKDAIKIAGLCLQTSALQGQPHQIEGTLSIGDDVQIQEMKCTCKAGLSGMCKHISALLLYCTRMDINSIEMLSSTDVECYWKKAKLQAKEKYKPQPIINYQCLMKTRSRLKVVRELTKEEMKRCLEIGMECVPDSNISKHFLRRQKNQCLPSTSSHSNVPEIPTVITCILMHSESSEFLTNLAKDVFVEKFSMEACCMNKWKVIEKCDIKRALMLSQNSDEWHKFRQFRITGSDCYSIFTYSLENNDECWQRKTKQCFFPKKFTNEYVRHGRDEEKNALKVYKQSTGQEVMEDLGIIMSKRFLWLGFSPDAVVFENNVPVKLVEIKCPFIGKTKDTDSFLIYCRYLKMSPSGLELSKKHPYYGQIQLGLSLLNLQTCDLLIYSSFSKKYLKLEIKDSFRYLGEN